ncbi:MAG: PAS domain S-box protein [Pseudomonadota bacterium]
MPQEERRTSLDDLFGSCRDAIFEVDAENNIRWCNRAAEQFLGYAPGELIGKPGRILFANPSDHDGFAFSIGLHLMEGHSLVTEFEHVRKDGTKFTAEVRILPLCKPNGRVEGFLGLHTLSIPRQPTEELLLRSREQLQMIVTGAPLILFACDRNGMFTLTEGKGLEALGVKPGDAVGQSIFQRYKDEPEVMAAAHRVIRGETFSQKIHFKGLTFDASIVPIRDNQGELDRVIGVMTDVTEREKAEIALHEAEERNRQLIAEQLRASNERYHALAEAASDGIAVIDPTGSIQYTNPAMDNLFGYGAGGLTDTNILRILPGLDLHALAQSWAERDAPISKSSTRPAQLSAVHRLGREFAVEVSLSSYKEENHRQYVAIIRDVTERTRNDEQLADMNRFLDSIVENIPDMIFVKDAERLSFVRFNRAGEDLLGYSRDQLFGKNDYDFFPKEEADFFVRKDREVLKSGKLLDIPEEPIQTAKHGLRVLHTKKIPIVGARGEPRYLLGISEDITERKQLEAKLVEHSRMAGIGQVAAGIAHEVRNPLFGISTVAQILAKAAARDPELKELSQRMLAEINRVKKLVEDLLWFARPRKMERRSFAPERLWREVVSIPQTLTMDRRIQLKEEMSALRRTIEGDPDQIRQVLINLYLNALQFSPVGGTIRIRSRFEEGATAKWLFSIENDGPPVSGRDREKVFEPFYSTRKDGVGLGLAVCKKIVEEHGGTIQVGAEGSKRAVFELRLPLQGGSS